MSVSVLRLACSYELHNCTSLLKADCCSFRKLIDKTLKAFGKIDILVNNASMQEDLLDSFTGRAFIFQNSLSLQTPNSADFVPGSRENPMF